MSPAGRARLSPLTYSSPFVYLFPLFVLPNPHVFLPRRVWMLFSMYYGVDLTRGFLSVALALMDASIQDLQRLPETMASSVALPPDQPAAEAASITSSTSSSSSSSSTPVSSVDAAASAPLDPGVLQPFIASLDDGVSAVICCVGCRGGTGKVYCNDKFKSTFFSSEDLTQRTLSESTLPVYVYACIIAPEDRAEFVDSLTNVCFGTQTALPQVTHIVKVLDRQGSDFLAIVRLRCLTLNNGDYGADILTVEPAPMSKYVLQTSDGAGTGQEGPGGEGGEGRVSGDVSVTSSAEGEGSSDGTGHESMESPRWKRDAGQKGAREGEGARGGERGAGRGAGRGAKRGRKAHATGRQSGGPKSETTRGKEGSEGKGSGTEGGGGGGKGGGSWSSLPGFGAYGGGGRLGGMPQSHFDFMARTGMSGAGRGRGGEREGVEVGAGSMMRGLEEKRGGMGGEWERSGAPPLPDRAVYPGSMGAAGIGLGEGGALAGLRSLNGAMGDAMRGGRGEGGLMGSEGGGSETGMASSLPSRVQYTSTQAFLMQEQQGPVPSVSSTWGDPYHHQQYQQQRQQQQQQQPQQHQQQPQQGFHPMHFQHQPQQYPYMPPYPPPGPGGGGNGGGYL